MFEMNPQKKGEDVGWKRKIGKRRKRQKTLKKKQRGTSLY